jgi:hypothetical protein
MKPTIKPACKHISYGFPIQNGQKQEDAISPMLHSMPLGESKKIKSDYN